MDIRTENKINLKAWLEALGMKEIPDEKIMSEIRKVEQMIISAVSPKAIYRIMEPSELRLEGKSIKKASQWMSKNRGDGSDAGRRCRSPYKASSDNRYDGGSDS